MNLTQNERQFLNHMSMWGSDGYPVSKIRSRWHWHEFYSINGAPTVYKTKREAVAAVEAYLDILRDKCAGRL